MAERQNLLSAVDSIKNLYKFPTSTVVTKTGFRIILSTFFYRKEFRFRMFSYMNAPLRISKNVETSVALKKHILGVSKRNNFGFDFIEMNESELNRCKLYRNLHI